MPEDEFIPGRMAMTCCAQDMSFLGFICKADKKQIAPFQTRDWAKVKVKGAVEEREEYNGVGPVLHLQDIVRTGEIADPVRFLGRRFLHSAYAIGGEWYGIRNLESGKYALSCTAGTGEL